MKETVKKTASPAKPRKSAPRKKAATAVETAPQPEHAVTHEQVAQLAHRYFTERGQKHGHHEDDWFRAERELRGKAS